jgi:hypothetical protein
MPYELHITRKRFWADPGDDISSEEWRALVKDDHELAPCPDRGQNAAQWIGPSARPETILDWSYGNVVAANPDRPLIDKMVGLASRLDARVQGVNGELYNLCGAEISADAPSLGSRIAAWFHRSKR